MRPLVLYIAQSLNGKIAHPDGDVAWLENLPNPDQTDYGYKEFLSGVDTTIQGYSTYAQLVSWDIDFPYIGMENYVLTTRENPENNGHVVFWKEGIVDKVKELKARKGKTIWLIGGGSVNALLLEAGLVDEIRIFIMPIILKNGIDVTAQMKHDLPLTKPIITEYSSGVVELVYKLTEA